MLVYRHPQTLSGFFKPIEWEPLLNFTPFEAGLDQSQSSDELIDEASLAAGEALFRRPIDFLKGVVNVDGLPPADRPEIAFAGRSNVGKSSLLNALTRRKTLARTSNTPGRTREINYFTLDDAAYLVDMPGYGYAKVPKELVAGWTRLIEAYLRGRNSLKRTFLLIDSRHGVKKNDVAIMGQLDQAAQLYQVVLTKTDKLKPGQLASRLAETETLIKKHPACYPLVLATSSQKNVGLEALRASVYQALES